MFSTRQRSGLSSASTVTSLARAELGFGCICNLPAPRFQCLQCLRCCTLHPVKEIYRPLRGGEPGLRGGKGAELNFCVVNVLAKLRQRIIWMADLIGRSFEPTRHLQQRALVHVHLSYPLRFEAATAPPGSSERSFAMRSPQYSPVSPWNQGSPTAA